MSIPTIRTVTNNFIYQRGNRKPNNIFRTETMNIVVHLQHFESF